MSETVETNGTQAPRPPRGRKPAAPVAPPEQKAVAPVQADQAKNDKMPVEQAHLHSAVMFQGVTSDNWNEAKAQGTKMLWVRSEGLLLGRNGKEMLIPSANVKGVIFASKNSGRTVES